MMFWLKVMDDATKAIRIERGTYGVNFYTLHIINLSSNQILHMHQDVLNRWYGFDRETKKSQD